MLTKELVPYFELQAECPLVDTLAAGIRRKDVRTIDMLVEANRAIQERIKYLIRLEPGIQPPDATLKLGSGSCRDSGWRLPHSWL